MSSFKESLCHKPQIRGTFVIMLQAGLQNLVLISYNACLSPQHEHCKDKPLE